MSEKRPRGRPPAYRDEFAPLARNLCLMGHATEDELAVLFGVSSRSIRTWKRQYPDFARAIQDGTLNPNARVTGALFEQCMQGNVTAIIWWQKNKMGWRDKVDHDLSGDLKLSNVTDAQLDHMIAQLLTQVSKGGADYVAASEA